MIDLHDLLADAPAVDAAAHDAVADRAAQVLRPTGALARLDHLAAWLAGWQRTTTPAVRRPGIVLAAADHGVASRGVSAYPAAVTAAMVGAIEAGVATSSALATHLGVAVELVDVGVGAPTGDLVTTDALDPSRAATAFAAGRDAVARLDPDLLCVGEMGIGNTTAAAAVAAALAGGEVAAWVGHGTGVDAAGHARKVEAVAAAVRRVGHDEPFALLRRLGGAEMVALAGAVIEARRRSVPVLLDGYVATTAVAPLAAAVPDALDHCVAAHRSPEPGHGLLLARLGMEPLLALDMRLGEGAGALLAVPLVAAAAVAVTDVATFGEWGLS